MTKSMDVLDSVRLNFSEGGFVFLNIILALIMFGVALEIKPENLKRIFINPILKTATVLSLTASTVLSNSSTNSTGDTLLQIWPSILLTTGK